MIVRSENISGNLIILLTFIFVLDVTTQKDQKCIKHWNRKPTAEYFDGSHTNAYHTKHIQN